MKSGRFLKTEALEKAYLGKRVHDFLATISEQVDAIYKQRGIHIPVTASSTLQYIAGQKGVSLADIARALEVTHQITTQRVHKLEKIGLVEKRADMNDRRRFEWHLTPLGHDQAKLLESCMADAALVYQGLYDQLNLDLADALQEARNAILEHTLNDRFTEIESHKKVRETV